MKDRHWGRIARVLGLHGVTGTLTLGAVWSSGLAAHADEVASIVKSAQGETVIEQARDRVF